MSPRFPPSSIEEAIVSAPDNEQDPQNAVTATHAATGVPTQCDECSAPVEEEQRYCVVCGAHRRHVEDPAARYLSELTARARVKRSATVARPVRQGAVRGRGLGLAVALALVPVAAAVGVVAERSANNGNAKLIHALVLERQAANADAASSTSAGSTATTGGATTSANAGSGKTGGATGSKKGSHTKGSKHAKTSKSSKIPGGTAISTAPPSAAQKQAGQKATNTVQKSKGQSYVKGQNKLPGTVVVP
jgi:hypothetical protein